MLFDGETFSYAWPQNAHNGALSKSRAHTLRTHPSVQYTSSAAHTLETCRWRFSVSPAVRVSVSARGEDVCCDERSIPL